MSTTVALQSISLIALRLALFSIWRKYLSKSLYPDLASLSLQASPSGGQQSRHAHTDSVELSILPSPATTPMDRNINRRVHASQKLLHSSMSRAIFSLVLTESCIVFLLLILQAMDVFSPRTRLYNWRYSLVFLILSILALIPQCMSLLLVVGMQSNEGPGRLFGFRIVISFIPVILFLFAVAHIPLPTGFTTPDIMTSALSRLIILGTIILGLLSGFGAISNAWGFIPFLSTSIPEPTEQQIFSAEYSLTAVRNDLAERRATAARSRDLTSDGSWLSRVGATFRPNNELDQELRGLEALEHEMTRKLESLREARNAAKFALTWKGRALNVIGHLFATYCVARVFNSLANIVLPNRRLASTTTYSDIISELLVYILSWIYTSRHIQLEDVIPIARQLSLIFVGIMILTSIRLVLRGVTRALRVTSRNLGASLMLLILAQLMGIYLLSTVVQMRSSFPPPPKPPNDGEDAVNLFSTIPPYEVFGSLFDWSFLIAAATAATVRWGVQKMNNAGEV